MVLSTIRRTFFANPTPVPERSYVPDIVMKASDSAVVRAVESLKAMNLDPAQPSTYTGDVEPTALGAYECRAIARMPFIVPMIAPRITQARQAGKRRLTESDFGYEIVHRDPKKTLSKKQMRTADDIYEMLERGRSMSEKMALIGRDSFEIDRGVGEIKWAASGVPYLWDPWDGATMRWAVPTDEERDQGRYNELDRPVVQWLNGQQKRMIPRKSAIVLIRNPTTDIWRLGFGYPEVEMGADDIHRGIQADFRNGSYFDNGFGADFILKLKMKLGEDEFLAFQEQLQSTMRGLKNSHRVGALLLSPKMQGLQGSSEEDIEKLDLTGGTPKDMEYRFLLAYYYRRVSSIMGIDPEEYGMGDPADTGKAALSEPDSSWKIAMSKEKGLGKFLDVCSIEFTRQLVQPFDPDLKLVFLGLNSLSPEKQAQFDLLDMQRMTLNEWRASKNKSLIKIEGQAWPDECPLHPLAVQLYTAARAQAQQAQQQEAAMQAQAQGAQEPDPDAPDIGPDGVTGEMPEPPRGGPEQPPADDQAPVAGIDDE